MKKVVLAAVMMVVAIMACRRDDPAPQLDESEPARQTRSVVFDLNDVPYPTLSEYQFFEGPLANMVPSARVLPFEPITPLFTDYAHKKRFVWMPEGVQATYNSDGTILEFPDGAVLIKNFFYDHVQPDETRRIIETRLLFRKNGAWSFADYIWNAEQTEAYYSLSGGYTSLIWRDDHEEMRCVTYRIPSEVECHTCHKVDDLNSPIGVKPQNLNSVYTYSDGPMNQLQKWEQMGYLASGWPTDINTVAKWNDPSRSLQDRVRAYVDMNCAHCHSEGRHCDYRPMRFAWSETADPVNLGVCVVPEDLIEPSQTHIVAAGNPARSMMYFRMNTTDEAARMPLFGRTLVHQEAVDLVRAWISSITPPCP